MTSSTVSVDDFLSRAFILLAIGMFGFNSIAFVLLQLDVEINVTYFLFVSRFIT